MESENMSPESQSSSRKPARRTVPGLVLRIVLVAITGSVIGGAIYFSAVGWIPYLDQRVIQPIDNHQQEIQDLVAAQGMLETEVADLSAALAAGQAESDQDTQTTQQALQETITGLENSLDALENRADQNTYFSATLIPSLLSTAAARQELTDRNLSALATAQMGLVLDSQEAALLKVLAMLSRANQFLLHDDFGSAREALTAASDYLLEISGGTASQDQQIAELLDVVQGASAVLPGQPGIAASKLELAWQMTLEGLDDPGAATPAPDSPPSLTPTPTPN